MHFHHQNFVDKINAVSNGYVCYDFYFLKLKVELCNFLN